MGFLRIFDIDEATPPAENFHQVLVRVSPTLHIRPIISLRETPFLVHPRQTIKSMEAER